MAKKKKEEIDISGLDPRTILEETVASSKLGRTIASLGATLTGREKRYANLVYYLIQAEKEFSDRWSVVTQISEETKPHKTSPSDAIKWFAEKYPKEAQPLLARLEKSYNKTEKSISYGLRPGRELPDNYYVQILQEVLNVPQHEATILYHGVLKPVFKRVEEEEGLTKLIIKK